MKLVGYVRVSTNHQAEEGFGLEVQEAAIRTWCKANKHSLVGLYVDAGISGSNGLDTRVGLVDALDALTGPAQGLVVARLDRLARALHLQEGVLQEAWRHGARVFEVGSGEIVDDPDDPQRTFVRQIMGAVAQLERGLIRRRTMAGREAKAARGGYIGGSPPYGWAADHQGGLVEVPNEQAVIAQARRLRAQGASLRQIGAQLEAAGMAPRTGAWLPVKVKRLLGE